MKSLVPILLLTAMLLLTGIASADFTPGSNHFSFSSFKYSPNGVSNFSVNINGRMIEVFQYFNISGSPVASNSLFIGNDKLTSLDWQGSGNVSVVPSLAFSPVGTFSFGLTAIEYTYLYGTDYLGILLTTGEMEEEGNEITINSSGNHSVIDVSYVTSPISYYDTSQNGYLQSGNSYSGTYSSFSYSSGRIQNYSLMNSYSSLSVISNIGSSASSNFSLSLNMTDLVAPGSNAMFASDSLSPLIYLSGFNSSISVELTSAFHFTNSGASHIENNVSIGLSLPRVILSIYKEQVYRINNGNVTLGYVDVYGNAKGNDSSLSFTSPFYFAVIRFLPTIQTASGSTTNNGVLGAASSEIFINSNAYFFPLSPNVTSQTLSFRNNILNFKFLQNGSARVVVVVEGNFRISSFSLSGPEGNSSTYTLVRASNETIISFKSNGSGQKNLSLSVSPIENEVSSLPLITLVVSAVALIAISLSLIFYSRKKWINKLEKE